jgi:hypothetical protein
MTGRKRSGVGSALALASLMLAAACTHGEPFDQDDFSSDSSLTRGPARQMTFNLGTDLTPGWKQDGSAFAYMFEDVSRDDRDRCLAELPATGGTMRNILCPATLESFDSVDALYEPAFGPDGRLLYLREASLFNSATPFIAALMLNNEDDPLKPTVVRTYPYTASNGKLHQGIADVTWLSATTAVYVAQEVIYSALCSTCPLDTLRTGIELVKVNLAGPAPTTEIVPNTAEISSVSAGTDGDEIFFTRNGDSRVYSMNINDGAASIVHDFGGGQIARDVSVVDNRLLAVVGGKVSFLDEPILGPVQRDDGGEIRMVDLTTGAETPLGISDHLFRRPALSPARDRLVAEGISVVVVNCGPGCADTVLVGRSADLWLFEVP